MGKILGGSRRRAVVATVGALVAVLALLVPRVAATGSRATATLRDTAGVEVGTVKLNEVGPDGKVEIRATVHGLTAGFHGFHIHTIGACTPDFLAAGGHFNPAGGNHPAHAGDQPVLLVNADGTGSLTFVTDRYKIADLFDPDGSAFIVHANADNYANIPTDRYDPDPDSTTLATGDAGSRTACGVIQAGG
jgi:Cu-Zn family superoxide dismutase